VADKNKIASVLTQAQIDAEAMYAKAASISPDQAALIKRNAQGNIMSPGVLQALSALGVDGKSGVANSIASIDAQTRNVRLANQKDLAQQREQKAFDDSNKGKFWRALKNGVRLGTAAISVIPQYIDATYRTTRSEIQKRGVVSGLATGLGINQTIGVEAGAVSEQIVAQTTLGQLMNKSIADVSKGKAPDINLGRGFFPDEETGLGHAARQASLDAAKIAIRNSKNEVIGYRPRTFFGDPAANIFTLGNPESEAGQVIALVADIAGSFMVDPGISRGQRAKELRKLAAQERAKGALSAAAKLEERATKIDEAATRAMDDLKAVRAQDTQVKKLTESSVDAEIKLSKSAREGKATEAIKGSIGVRTAQSRLDEIAAYEKQFTSEAASAKESRKAIQEALNAPKVVARQESALAKQLKQIDELKANNEAAVAAGRLPMVSADEIAQLEAAVSQTQQKLQTAQTAAKQLVGENAYTEQHLADAIATEKQALARMKEAKSARKASEAQVLERERTAKIAYRAREIASKDYYKTVKSQRTLAEKLDDATFGLKAKRSALADSIKNVSNIEQTYQRPEFAYQAIAEFLTGGHGTRAVDALVEVTDWKAIWRKGAGRIDHATAQALAAAKNPDDIVDILAPYLLRGDVQAGVLRPGLLSRAGERITERTAFAMPVARTLQGVGARVESRLKDHEKVANLFSKFINPTTNLIIKTKDGIVKNYTTKIKSGAIVNVHDREELLRATEDFGKAAKLPKQILDNIIDEIATARSNGVAGYAASVKLMEAVFAHHAEKVPAHLKASFDKYTTSFKSSVEEMSSYWASRHSQGAELKYMTVRGEQVILPGPHMSSELLNSTVYFPPVGELLKLTSKLSKYKTLSSATEIGDTLIGNFWKQIQLVRPAYIIRNIAEEQIRVGALGHISFFTSPGMALSLWLGRQEGPLVRRLLYKFDTYKHTVFDESFSSGDLASDILNETAGHKMANSYVKIMNADVAGSFDDRAYKVLSFKNVGAVPYGHKRFFDGVANQLRMLNSDEVARVVAGHDTAYITKLIDQGMFREDAVIDYFLNGPGRKEWDSFLESVPENTAVFFRTPEGAKAYLYNGKNAETGEDISMLARVTEAAGGNKSLMQMIAKGKTSIGGEIYEIPTAESSAINSISNSKQMASGKKELLAAQEQFARKLDATFSKAGNWDGILMNVPSRNLAAVVGSEDKNKVKRFVDGFFDKATELEKNSTFGPEYRQAYWDAINTVAKALDSNAKAKLAQVAESSLTPLQKAGVPIGTKHPVWNAFKAATGDGPLTLEDAHKYADNFARNQVKELFYNAHSKRLIFHQLRLVAPFAAAWEDTIKKWSELAIENPLQLYKGIKTLDWLQKPESSAIYQLTDAQDYYNPDQGFFFTDPDSGQRQFFVPFAGTVMAKLAKVTTGANYSGAPMAFAANPMSFNFAFGAGTILPGIGPGITLPLSVIGTFKGNWIDSLPLGVQRWLFPFGRADFSSGLQSAILPGNWNKILGAGGVGSENSYASNFKPVMNYLASGGNYNLDNPDDQARLIADTDTFSRWQSAMRGLFGLVSPMPLIQKGLAQDKDGDVTLQFTLQEDFQTLLQNNDGDYNKTWYDFLNLYGASQAFAIISSSAGNGPSNWESYNFVVKNPDVATKYTDVWGYVMPGGGLSNEMYNWNLIHDTKKKLNAKEILQKVNNQRFYAARDALMTKVDSGEMDRKQYTAALQYLKDSMGGGPVVEFDPNKRGRIIKQLETLVTDERFAELPSVAGLRDYMGLRAVALSNLGKSKFTGAQNEQSERDWLAAQAQWIVKDNPDFQKMFYAFFANELEGK
jgi:hypothetical protein